MSPRRTARPPRPSRWRATLALAAALGAGVACGDGAEERRLDIEIREPPPAEDRTARDDSTHGDGAGVTADAAGGETAEGVTADEATAADEASAEAEDAAAPQPAGDQ